MQPSTNGHKASPQQQAVIDWGRDGKGNIFVEAVAGAGKTTTLIAACRYMQPPQNARWWSVAFLAFNKKIAEEVKEKLEKLRAKGVDVSYVKAGTFHSFGMSAWRKAHPGVVVLKDREYRERMFLACGVSEDLHGFVGKLVGLAMQGAVTLLWQPEERVGWYDIVEHHDLAETLEDSSKLEAAVDLAIKCIQWARENGGRWINFDAMLWLPTVCNIKLWQHDRVLVDEAQDTNPCRREFARKLLKDRGRVAFVGDRHQAIYGFTGADNDAVDQIVSTFRCKQLPLTVSYRCPKLVVAEAQRYVSHIQAHESAPDGAVRDLSRKDFVEKGVKELVPTDAILCRNTKPLVACAFRLLRSNVACYVEGRDIGEGLMALIKKYKVKTAHALREKLEAFRDKEVAKLLEQKKETKAEQLQDRIDTLLVLAEGCDTIDCIKQKIASIFKDRLNPDGTENKEVRNSVCLSTVHKSKGREWPRVYILGFERYMPSRWAKQQWQRDQENNLIYVAITRSQGELIYLEALEDEKRKAA